MTPFLSMGGGGDHCKVTLYGLSEEATRFSGAADGAAIKEKVEVELIYVQ